MLGDIIGTLSGGVGGVPGEAHDTKLVDDAFTLTNYGDFDNLVSTNTVASRPKAYLNYILFDNDMKIVPEMSGAFQANGNGTWTQID